MNPIEVYKSFLFLNIFYDSMKEVYEENEEKMKIENPLLINIHAVGFV